MTVNKKKRLGRGLDALFSDVGGDVVSSVNSSAGKEPNAGTNQSSLPVEKMQPGQYQPRTNMDQASLEELAESIRAQGIIQPILVRPIGEDKYEIIAGERRWRAAQLAQLAEVPVLVRNIPDEATLAVALIENIQRENLNPIEEAVGLKRLMDEFGLTHEEMAKSVGRSRAAVTNLLRLLGLNKAARELLESGKIEMGHARALLALQIDQQHEVALEVVAKKLSVRQTEALVKTYTNDKSVKKATTQKTQDILSLESDLSERLGTTVTVQDNKGKGKVIIEYKSLDILDGVLAHIK